MSDELMQQNQQLMQQIDSLENESKEMAQQLYRQEKALHQSKAIVQSFAKIISDRFDLDLEGMTIEQIREKVFEDVTPASEKKDKKRNKSEEKE